MDVCKAKIHLDTSISPTEIVVYIVEGCIVYICFVEVVVYT
jgi:hypothetical protein